jgi:hypothetical protein
MLEIEMTDMTVPLLLLGGSFSFGWLLPSLFASVRR